jgi:hypothetical protein
MPSSEPKPSSTSRTWTCRSAVGLMLTVSTWSDGRCERAPSAAASMRASSASAIGSGSEEPPPLTR